MLWGEGGARPRWRTGANMKAFDQQAGDGEWTPGSCVRPRLQKASPGIFLFWIGGGFGSACIFSFVFSTLF